MGTRTAGYKPTKTTEQGGGSAPAPRRWVVYYDDDCGICVTTKRWLAPLDLRRRVTWTAIQGLEQPPQGLTWKDLQQAAYLEDTRSGRLYRGFYAFRRLTLLLPPLLPLAPLFWFPGVEVAGRAVYRFVATHRHRISRCRLPGFKGDG
jgi:predicted DCC family thiol-disulfide oxidoreductase YuxK